MLEQPISSNTRAKKQEAENLENKTLSRNSQQHLHNVHATRSGNDCGRSGPESTRSGNERERSGDESRTYRYGNRQHAVNICTYNARTLHGHHMETFLKQIRAIRWDVIGVCETKLKNNFHDNVSDGRHIFYNSGVSETSPVRKNGVGFLVHDKHRNNVVEFRPISERIGLLKLKGGGTGDIVIIQVYAPTSAYDKQTTRAFYDHLQQTINNIPQQDDLFVMGDFNSKVGGLRCSFPEVIGEFSNTQRGFNTRGEELLHFCVHNKLCVTNTYFKHTYQHTWTSPGHRTRNTIDFVLVKQCMMERIVDSCVRREVKMSDHNLLCCTVHVNMFVPSPSHSESPESCGSKSENNQSRTKKVLS